MLFLLFDLMIKSGGSSSEARRGGTGDGRHPERDVVQKWCRNALKTFDPGMNMAQGAGEVAASAALGDRAAIDASADALALIASQARSWLFESAAELWRAEPGGGTSLFPERMAIHGERDACPHRLFVQARWDGSAGVVRGGRWSPPTSTS